MMNTQSTASSPQKVYRQIGLWRIMPLLMLALGLGFSSMFVVLIFTVTSDPASRIVFLVGALIMAVLGVLLFIGLRGMRLVTSPQGVILYGVGYRVYTPWDNIKGIGEDSYGGNNGIGRFYQASRRVEGFLFYRPALFGLTIEEGLQQHTAVIQGMVLLAVQITRYVNMLPLSGFLNETTRQELIDDAKKYAPHTFQTVKDTFGNHRPIFQNE
jgi:hypothetical protein